MARPVCVKDFEPLAKNKLTKNAWDYYCSGATDEQTLQDNCAAFKRYKLRPYVLNDVSQVDISSSVLGDKIEFPVCIASTAMNKLAHEHGEIAAAKAASSLGCGFMQSTLSTTSIEDIAEVTAGSLKWMQLYIFKTREITKKIVERAERSGYKAIFVTVDTPVLGRRYNDARNHFLLPSHLRLANFKSQNISEGIKSGDDSGLADFAKVNIDPSLQWKDIAWLKSISKLPIVLKGIITAPVELNYPELLSALAEMAAKAVEHGVDGIMVSNHGARQLDGVPATIDALPEVIKVVNGRCDVFLDGGIRNGTDVLKAVAMGAKAVFIGRPVLWGLAYDGENGVKSVLSILRDEFETSMQLMGCRSVEELQEGKNLVVPQTFYPANL